MGDCVGAVAFSNTEELFDAVWEGVTEKVGDGENVGSELALEEVGTKDAEGSAMVGLIVVAVSGQLE